MFELKPLGAHTYVITPAPDSIAAAYTNVGVWEQNGHVALFDSGLNDQDAQQLLDVLEAQNWTLDAVYNTHYHADHVGGNHCLQEKTGCPCYCPLPLFATKTILNPSFLFGSWPPEPLKAEILLAQSSDTQELTPECLPAGVTMIPMHGHSYEQYAFRTPDDVLFIGDALLGAEEFARPQLSYIYNFRQHMETLDRLEQMPAAWFVPSHGEPQREVQPLLEINRNAFLQIRDWILEFCAGDGMSQDELLKALFDRMHRHLHLVKYAIAAATVHAYLTDLIDSGLIIARAKENIIRFRVVKKKS